MPASVLRATPSAGEPSPAFLAALEAVGRTPLGADGSLPVVTLPVVEDAEDRPIDLERRHAGRPVLVLLYAGGWSRPCVEALRILDASASLLAARSFGVVALAPESVGQLGRTAGRNGLSVFLGHDHASRFARSLGLTFRLNGEARAWVRAAGVRLSLWNGESSFELPQPATILLSADRTARIFQPDRHDRRRTDVEAAVRAALAPETAAV